ncbi:MAG: dethiobiotin synthase [Gilvibacter sp.]
MERYFVTGIGTEVGKTLVAAVVAEALKADYWKPIQAGSLMATDTHSVQYFINNDKTQFYPSAYELSEPMSPHAAAAIDGIEIDYEKIIRPTTKNNLVIEGAGGLLVPINQSQTVADLIKPEDKVIVVSRHYLGSINHTLLTLNELKNRGIEVLGLVFSGDAHPSTEQIIEAQSGVKVLGRIDEEPYFDANVITYYAGKFKKALV